MTSVTSYSAYLAQPVGGSNSGLDQTLGWIARDPGLAGANEAGSISSGIAAADGLNRLIAEGLRAIHALDKRVLLAADIVALNGWFRDQDHPERLELFLELHGDDENGTETGFHTIQNDGGNRRFDGRALIDTVLDGLYHIGFPLSADGTRLTNEDGNDNATLTDVARWLTLLKQDLATSGSDLDRIVETIVADPGLQASITPVQIAGGAQAANDLNQLILAGIAALYERGRADRDDTRLSAAEVTWINGWIQSDPARYAFFVERHGDDENGVETGYHLVQNDGATTQLFGQNAVNTIYDGIYHIGFTINADGRFQNEDGDANARVSDVAEWITYYYGDPSTTGSGLDRLVDWIRLDPGLAKQTSALDINDGLAAANSLNGIFLEAVTATDVNLDGWISRNDLRIINRWVRTNRYSAFVLHHGDDENGEETGFHKIQNDGATTQFFGQNLVNTVADGIYHYGFEIRGDNFLNEDGDTNQSLSDVSGWVNYFLSNRRLTLGSDNGETIAGNDEAEQVLARGGDDVVDGFGGSDLLDGGWGNDTLRGGVGADVLDGGFGDDNLDGGEDGDTYLASGADPSNPNWQTYSFQGYDSYADSGSNGVDVILAQGAGAVDIGLRQFGPSNGIEQIVNATEGGALVTLLGNWQANVFDFSTVALIGGNFLINAGDGNDTVIGTAGADLIQGGRGDDSLNGGGGGDTYLVSGYDPTWYADRPYTFHGYDNYADSGAAGDGVDQIVATGSGPVDIGFSRDFSAASGIEQIVNATEGSARVTLLGNWQANNLDFSNVALVGSNFLIDAGDGNDTVIGTAGADLIQGGRGDDSLDGGGGADTYLVSGLYPNGSANQPYTFSGFDSYRDSGAAGDGSDQIVATGSGPVDIGLSRDFSAASGIEQIVNATEGGARVTLLGDWQTNRLDFSNVALIGGNIVIDAGDGNDVVIGTAGADLIRGGRGEDSLDGGGGSDTYLVSGYDPAWYNNRPYTFEGYDSYADSGAADDGIDQIIATGSGPVDIGLSRDFSAGSGIEQIVNATEAGARVTLLGDWQTNVFDFSGISLIGGNFLLDAGDGNDVVIGTAGADLIRGGRGEDSLDGGGGGDTYLVSGYDPAWYNDRPYTFNGYDSYADSGAADDGLDQILATGSGPVDVGLGREFSASSGIEQIVNATTDGARITLLGNWDTDVFDFSTVSLVGGNFLINPGDGNDVVIGTAYADLIQGGRGDDNLDGGGGGDTYLVSGFDPTWYADRPYTFNGYDTYSDSGAAGDGLDQIVASGSGPVDIGLGREFSAFSGIEQIINATSNASQVRLVGCWEANSWDFSTVTLSGGNVVIAAGDGQDTVRGSAAADRIRGGRDNDWLDGGGGNDTYEVSGSDPNWYADRPYTFEGYDTYADSSGYDRIVAVAANGRDNVDIAMPSFSLASGIELIDATGTTGSVRLLGSSASNNFDFSATELRGSNLRIDLGDGNDSFVGSSAGDTVSGGYGDDRISGRAGDDTISGGGGNDILDGGEGSDTYLVSGLVSGGWQSYGGSDTYSDTGKTGTDRITAVGGDNVDIGLAGGNFLTTTGIEQIVNSTSQLVNGIARVAQVRLVGSSAANTLNFGSVRFLGGNIVIDAGDGNDTVTGSVDAETILAGLGADTVNAGAGDDKLSGGGGLDSLTGGSGADTFVYTTLSDGSVGGSASARTFEKIIGFTVGLDRFDLTTVPPAGGFRNLGAVAGLNDTALGNLLSATNFVANGAATFSFGSGTSLRSFIAFNDASAGYNASSDAVLEISGFSYASGFNSLAQISLV